MTVPFVNSYINFKKFLNLDNVYFKAFDDPIYIFRVFQ